MKKGTFLTLIFCLFMFACTSYVSPTIPLTSATDEPVLPEATTPKIPTESASETPLMVVESGRPVVIAYLADGETGREIVSRSLRHPVNYARIAVEDSTTFQGSAAIDSEHNLYLVYGFKEKFVSKLSADGTVKTLSLVRQPFHALWIGDKLLIVPETADNEMMVIDQNLTMRVISPSLLYLSDGTRPMGQLGIGNDPAGKLAVWVDTMPVSTSEGEFARYRTLDVETGEVVETLLSIPEASGLVMGVDLARQNVLICKQRSLDNQVFGVLEIYDSSSGKTVTEEDRCCMHNRFDLRGDTIVENSVPESCSYQRVRNWSDYQPAIDFADWLSDGEERLFSNGRYWIVQTEGEVVVFDEEQAFEGVFEFPDDLPENLMPGISLTVAFLMDD